MVIIFRGVRAHDNESRDLMNGLTRRQMVKAMAVAAGTVTASAFTLGANTSVAGANPAQEIKVLSLNTWHGGTKINGGLQLIADMIISTQASIVLLSEAGTATTALADMLTKSGTTFYGAASSDVGILSKFPIEETADLNSMIKAVVTVDGKQIAAYSAHLAYTSYATYLPRGYGAGVPKPGEFSEFGWNKMPSGPVTDPETVQRVNINSGRPKAISTFVDDAAKERAKGRSVILGGDFNEPSALDWTDGTRNLFDHNGVVVPWESTRLLDQAGFVDAYRSKYPNPATHRASPGRPTIPTSTPHSSPGHPRQTNAIGIDYIFADRASDLKLGSVGIIGRERRSCTTKEWKRTPRTTSSLHRRRGRPITKPFLRRYRFVSFGGGSSTGSWSGS